MSKAGQAEYVIIGVGGFLGIDQKDVAIPFAHVKFADQPMLPPANPAGFDTIGSSNNGGMTHGSSTTAVGGTAMAPNGAVTVPDTGAGAMTQNTASPDHGVIDHDRRPAQERANVKICALIKGAISESGATQADQPMALLSGAAAVAIARVLAEGVLAVCPMCVIRRGISTISDERGLQALKLGDIRCLHHV